MEKKLYNSVMIVGPTACGKTSLAVKLSEKYGGEMSVHAADHLFSLDVVLPLR